MYYYLIIFLCDSCFFISLLEDFYVNADSGTDDCIDDDLLVSLLCDITDIPPTAQTYSPESVNF